MGSFLAATAVTKLENGAFLIAAEHEGIFVKNKNDWVKILNLPNKRILDIKCIGQNVYGVGDSGFFIRSKDGGKKWRIGQFHTQSSMWSVCCNEEGLVITHSDKYLYLSRNFGESWQIIDLFKFTKNPPSLRSLCLYASQLFIGTKIHAVNGGIWRLDLKTGEMKKIKKELNIMIASMDVNDHVLMAACGSSQGTYGKIIFCELSQIDSDNMPLWETCVSEIAESCYLDLSWNDNVLYTTSTKNKNGIGKISRVFLNEKKVVPFGEVKGHGWRIVNQKEEYVVAGLYESYHYKTLIN